MKKAPTLLLILVIASVLGGVYGALHDQLTYSISPEYYTKFKFYQFGFVDQGDEAILPNPRAYVAVVGVLATWWMGLLIGLILGAVNLRQRDSRAMLTVTLRAFGLTMIVAFLTGLVGLAYGHFVLASRPRAAFTGWYLPENLLDFGSFITVGSMHNFSYLGGLLGMVAGIVFSLWQRRKAVKAAA